MKKIVVFGNDGVRNSAIYKEIQKILVLNKDKILINPVINYVENWAEINGEQYSFINTCSFNFPSKNDDLVTREMKILNDKLISSSDLLLWIINSQVNFSDHNFSIQKYLERKQKKYVIIFDNFDYSTRDEEDYLNDYYLQKLLRGKIKTYFLPLKSGFITQKLKSILSKELDFKMLCKDSFDIGNIGNNEKKNDILVKLTIFGPPNSGKSTLLNALIQEERSVVSQIAGTTKEDVFARWSRNNIDFQLKDTEGIINKKRNNKEILKDCNIALVIIDVSLVITKQTLQIVNLASKCEKAVLIILNKIDLISKYKLELVKEEIRSRLKSFSFVPIISISAIKGTNFSFLLAILDNAIKQSKLTFTKSFIENHFNLLTENNPPSNVKGKRLKIYYAIHETGFIHKFVVFVNSIDLIHFSYKRYIVNYLRRNFKIECLPIKLFFKKS
jgi:GTPase